MKIKTLELWTCCQDIVNCRVRNVMTLFEGQRDQTWIQQCFHTAIWNCAVLQVQVLQSKTSCSQSCQHHITSILINFSASERKRLHSTLTWLYKYVSIFHKTQTLSRFWTATNSLLSQSSNQHGSVWGVQMVPFQKKLHSPSPRHARRNCSIPFRVQKRLVHHFNHFCTPLNTKKGNSFKDTKKKTRTKKTVYVAKPHHRGQETLTWQFWDVIPWFDC